MYFTETIRPPKPKSAAVAPHRRTFNSFNDIMPIEVKCENCGNKTRKSQYELSKSKHHFCSKKCYYIYKKNNKSIYTKNYHIKKLNMFAAKRNELYQKQEKNWFYV